MAATKQVPEPESRTGSILPELSRRSILRTVLIQSVPIPASIFCYVSENTSKNWLFSDASKFCAQTDLAHPGLFEKISMAK
jgi:hypothetical protein